MDQQAPGAPVTFKGILLATTRLGYVIGNTTECQEYYFAKSDIRSTWFNKDIENSIEIEIPLHVAREKGVPI
jgi:uncharacterized protein (DUF427 family)